MRLLSIYYTHKPGGFCKRLYRLLNALTAAQHQVHYLTLDQPPAGELSTGVCVHLLPFPIRARRGLLFWALFTALAPFLVLVYARRLRVERTVVFGAYYSAVSFLTTLLRVPTILFLRSLVFRIDAITAKPWPIRIAAQLVERLGMQRATRVVCMTNSMRQEAEQFLGGPLNQCAILPNDLPAIERTSDDALPSAIRHKLSADGFRIVCAGVLDQRKNVSFLLQALATLPPTSAPWQLIVAGEGPLRGALEADARQLGLTSVSFTGWLPTLAPLLARSALLVHPALHEGIPNVILEALASNLPVLASDIPEHREFLKEDKLLFSINDPAALGRRIAQVAAIPSELSKLRELSIEAANRLRFDWNARAIQLIQDL